MRQPVWMNVAQSTSRPEGVQCQTTHEGAVAPAFEALFLGDWVRVVFMHYEVDAELLQREVPYALDLFKGRAFVSLVAFTMQRLRPRWGGKLTEWLFKPIANTHYLNVRTYVRHHQEAGIYFMAEFLSNPLCVPLGPPTFGLPYRFGHFDHRRDTAKAAIAGAVKVGGHYGRLSYQTTLAASTGFQHCVPGTSDAHLLERYTAFTGRGNKRRLFRIWHPPWLQVQTKIVVRDDGLLATTGEWANQARLVGANFSPGVRDVWMGQPRRIHPRETRRRLTVFFDI